MSVINRPWKSTFNSAFSNAPYNDNSMDQVFKLTRNFVSSLNLGNPNVKFAKHESGTEFESSKEAYLAWVSQWKIVYGQLSDLIRLLKTYRKTVRFKGHESKFLDSWKRQYGNHNKDPHELYKLCNNSYYKYEERLKETAQVFLNARYNAKLASAELKRRNLNK